MRKAAIILIVIAVAVVAGGFLYIANLPEPEAPPERNDTTLRYTEGGEVVGFIDDFGARAWMGVPFAAPPVGELRWKAPRPPARNSEVVEALAAGPMCPQFETILSGGELGGEPLVIGSEDCLYLNIWSPPNARDLPVMFWIHGGGNTIGHAGSFIGARLAATNNLVVVTTNYRLGVFGWFNHPALQTGNPADDSGNYGTLDLVRALEWTRDNIAAFGGDPKRVTVFGESAGAYNTLAMMASPLAAGLFHRAVVQSGGFEAADPVRGRNFSDEGGHEFSGPEIVNHLLVADGLADDTRGARRHQETMDNATVRDYLYGKSPGEIFAAVDGGPFGMFDMPDNFGDGHVLPNLPTDEIFSSAGNHNKVPVILGTNRDEPTLFMTRDPRYVDSTFGIFFSLKDEQTYRSLAHYGGRAWKARGVDQLAEAMTASGNPDVYAYRFDWDEEPSILGYDLSVALGAAHAIEIGFVFGEFNGLGLGYVYPDDENQWRLSDSVMSYWAEFAYTGTPGAGRDGAETPWLAWGQDGQTQIILDTPTDGGIRMDDDVVTYETLKAELVADADFGDKSVHCATYVRTFRDTDLFDSAEYEALGCSEWPPESISRF